MRAFVRACVCMDCLLLWIKCSNIRSGRNKVWLQCMMHPIVARWQHLRYHLIMKSMYLAPPQPSIPGFRNSSSILISVDGDLHRAPLQNWSGVRIGPDQIYDVLVMLSGLVGSQIWKKNTIHEIAFCVARILNFTPDLGYHQIRDAIIRALYVWSDVTEITFHEVQQGDADILIQFSRGYHQDGYPFDGPGEFNYRGLLSGLM